jgi:hypothetical protein
MHMMEHNYPRSSKPKWRKERHAIPNLDQSLVASPLASKTFDQNLEEDLVAPTSAHSKVSLSLYAFWLSRHRRGPQFNLQPSSAPKSGNAMCMQF